MIGAPSDSQRLGERRARNRVTGRHIGSHPGLERSQRTPIKDALNFYESVSGCRRKWGNRDYDPVIV